jgi:hypothetical protein
LVRASNTGAVLVMRFEGDSPARVTALRELVETQLHRIIEQVRAGQ